MQALSCVQSALTTHSGLQYGGLPIHPGKHEQSATPLPGLHAEYGPQGEGVHGYFCSPCSAKKIDTNYVNVYQYHANI